MPFKTRFTVLPPIGQRAAMRFGDLTGDSKPQPYSLGLGTSEGFKEIGFDC
jgi:hypothetical protein